MATAPTLSIRVARTTCVASMRVERAGMRLVKAGTSRYPRAMTPLTFDALRVLASERGLALSDAELEGLLPFIEASRALAASLPPLRDGEPAVQYRML